MINKLDSAESYVQLSKQYIAGLEIVDDFYLYFKAVEYTNERFVVGLYHEEKYQNAGFTFVYDFKLMKGSLMMFSAPPRKYVKGTIHEDKNAEGRFMLEANDYGSIDGEGYIHFTDDFDDRGNEWANFKYFAIINDSDDETVYSQLNAALLTCSNKMNL